MKKLYGFLNIFIFILVGFVIFNVLSPMYHALIVRGDALVWLWYGQAVPIEFFTKSDHSWIFMSVIWSGFGRFLPELLKIHPQVWYSNYYFWFLFGIMCLFLVALCNNFTKYFKNKNFCGLWILLIFPIVCGLMQSAGVEWIIADDGWTFAYLFHPLFFIALMLEIEKNYVQNDFSKISKSHKIALLLLFCCVAASHEFSRFLVCSVGLIGYFLHWIIVDKKFNHKKFWCVFPFVVFANIACFLSPRYQWWISPKLQSTSGFWSFLPSYLLGYIDRVLLDNIVLILVFCVLLAIIWVFAPKNIERKKIVAFSLATTISIFLFLLVISVGQEMCEFSYDHSGIRFLAKLYLFNVILSLCGWIINSLKINSFKAFTVILTFLPIFLSLRPIYYIDKQMIDLSARTKTRIYILERVFDLYCKQHKVYFNCYDTNSVIPKYSLIYFIYLYDKNANFEDYQQVDFCASDENSENCNKKLIKFLKEKTGYELTDEEIEKQDFQKYYGY